MGVPSVVKIKKGNVEFTSKVEIAKYSIRELTRRAMQDVGRYVLAKTRASVRGISKFTRKAKYTPQRYQMWVRRAENDLILGIENKRKGANTAWWADQAELGINNQPKRGILFRTVQENIPTIVQIEAQYLSYMNSEAAALSQIQNMPNGDIQE
ncbi:MAG: hypothetical protein ACI3WQ_09230 [Faecousia sp.]